jgi:hypothetical protein
LTGSVLDASVPTSLVSRPPVPAYANEVKQFLLRGAYDAVNLDLALRERLPLATLGDQLHAAAARAGVELPR